MVHTTVAQQSHNGAPMASSVAVAWTIHTVFVLCCVVLCCVVGSHTDLILAGNFEARKRYGEARHINAISTPPGWSGKSVVLCLKSEKHVKMWQEACSAHSPFFYVCMTMFFCMHIWMPVCPYACMQHACMCTYVSMQACIVCLSVGWFCVKTAN